MNTKTTSDDNSVKIIPLKAPRRGRRRLLVESSPTSSDSKAESEADRGNMNSTLPRSVTITYVKPKKSQLKVYTKGDLDNLEAIESDFVRSIQNAEPVSISTSEKIVGIASVLAIVGVIVLIIFSFVTR